MTDSLSNLITTDVATDVLVIGKGTSGRLTAQEIADQGFHVIVIDEANKDSETIKNFEIFKRLIECQPENISFALQESNPSNAIEYLSGTSLLHCQGMPGNFHLKLAQGNEILDKTVGAIVIATDYVRSSLYENYGLHPSEKIISQTQMEEILDSAHGQGLLGSKINNVAFVVGFGQEGNTLVMQRIMRCVRDLETHGCHSYIYVKNIKVAAEGLECLCCESRQEGAIYFKLLEKPHISSDGHSIVSTDPVLGKELELNPDLIVIEEAFVANRVHSRLAEVLRIDLGPWGFLQENNVHRFPVTTNREGIFVAGSSREVMNISGMKQDAANVALAVKQFLDQGQKVVPEYIGIVDKEKCCFCLTCFRCCPHGAIFLEDKPVISSLACQGCGICASECPQDAIQILAYQDDVIKDTLKQEIVNSQTPKIIAFCCENSSYEAGRAAQTFQHSLPRGLRMIKVPCAGKIDLDYLFTAFTHGADGVMVLSCHEGNCKSVRGNTFARHRVETLHHLMEEVGLAKERLMIATLASNMRHAFTKYACQMEETLQELGENPMAS
jgi:heterodisulfide reductase subunit A-like polyferredoxin/coenzyme F420-reducing hydrogenase delta subunit